MHRAFAEQTSADLASNVPRSVVSRPRIEGLQYLRAVAALMVMLYHAAYYLAKYRGGPDLPLLSDGRLGLYGVATFFALSGYLMAHLAPQAVPERFLAHRILRIYPIYLICVALFCLASPVLIGEWFTPRFLATTLMPVGTTSYALGVEWTLVYEVTFYVFIFLVIWAGAVRHLVAIALAWLALIAVGPFLLSHEALNATTPAFYALPFSTANVAFACGLMIPALLRRFTLPAWMPLLVLPAMAVFGFLDLAQNRVLGGVASALVVACALSWRLDAVPRLIHRPMMALGDASYALYLLHVPVLVGCFRWLPDAVAPLPSLAIAASATIALGLLFGRLDVGMYRFLKVWADGVSVRSSRILAWGFTALFLGFAGYYSVAALIERHESEQARAPLMRLMPLPRDGASFDEAIAKAGNAFDEPVGQVDLVTNLPDGRLAVAGWAFDKRAPDAATYVGAFCDGREVIWGRRTRLKHEAVAIHGQPDVRKVRIGFTIVSEGAESCPPGHMTVVAADERGKAWVVPAR